MSTGRCVKQEAQSISMAFGLYLSPERLLRALGFRSLNLVRPLLLSGPKAGYLIFPCNTPPCACLLAFVPLL